VNHADQEASIHLTANDVSDISSLIEPYRQELHLHCYRLLGSLQDAEDLVQETMLRAWQRFDTFKGSASLRTWLYTIATHACLDVLKKRASRTLPQVAYPAADPLSPLPSAIAEAVWLEPFPDNWLAKLADNPEVRYTRYESISLAFLTALQLLSPRQRAILILSDARTGTQARSRSY
jgi:RNA polymerase sigma-70 factor (ECF subfamily)